ncbi:MAG: hypothetical protein PHD02_04925 [Bacilli bacterium]|nr:hypothetical protein [Bacilli bacterium]
MSHIQNAAEQLSEDIKVNVGDVVVVSYPDGFIVEFELVNELSNRGDGIKQISINAPIGKAVLGKPLNTQCDVMVSLSNKFKIVIVGIKPKEIKDLGHSPKKIMP